ncbi:MAG: IPT/TIG domain-containing protein, partial [candidate division Zixibacteria bacterium]|nr:IPT/TIG domain-containing protein [candidate division Zixibacteria bacterium]
MVKITGIEHGRLRLFALVVLIAAVMPMSAFAQGSIFGTVQNSDLSTPTNGEISFVGFLDDTDEEIRIETSTGAGYDNGNWFDDFQNYLTEAPGNPYDYCFYNIANSEGFHLAKLIPNNSFQQEDIQLAPVSWPLQPTGLTATTVSSSTVVINWNDIPGLTYHVYRRFATSSGSFFRLDNPSGQISDPGVSDSFYVDTGVDGVSSYDYLIIAEDPSGDYSRHSTVATVSSAAPTAPVVTSIDPISGLAIGGTTVDIYGSGFDPAGASATVGVASLTGVTVVSPYHLTGTTQAGPAGPADIVVTNTASGLASGPLVGGYTYTANHDPVLAAIGDKGVLEGENLNFNTSATDADGDTPVLTSSALPGTAIYTDNLNGTGTFDWTPTFDDSGSYLVTFYASDGAFPAVIDSETITITVSNTNQEPFLAAIGDRGVLEGANLNFATSASDTDGDTPAMTSSALPGTAIYTDNLNGTGTFDWTPTFDDSGSYLVT